MARIEIGYLTPANNTMAVLMVPIAASSNLRDATAPLYTTQMQAGTSTTVSTPFFYIMNGTMPTDITTLTVLGSSAGTALVSWNQETGTVVTATNSGNTTSIDTPYKTATGSGTATWFWMGMKVYNIDPGVSVIWQQAIGSIGQLGSGADLEVFSTNVVAGNQYRVSNLKITYPLTLDY